MVAALVPVTRGSTPDRPMRDDGLSRNTLPPVGSRCAGSIPGKLFPVAHPTGNDLLSVAGPAHRLYSR